VVGTYIKEWGDAADETASGRYRLWELEAGTHCSVIGTCLSLDDLHRLIRKLEAPIAPGADDHDIHGYFVTRAATRSTVSKLVHKALDRKYAATVARFRSCTPDEAWLQWRQAMKSGDVAGAYWAIMTLRTVPRTMQIRAYNEIHMLSHLMGKSARDDIRRVRQLEAAQAELAARLERTRARADEAIRERDDRIRALEARLAEAMAIPRATAAPVTESRKPEGRNDRLLARFEILERRVKTERARARHAEAQLATIVEARTHAQIVQDTFPLSDACDEAHLAGQALLYVGGHREVTPRLRAHVEERGGTFLYHDGGVEMQNTRLSGLVSRADTVLCPVGCVSHDACLHLKRLCKRHGKRLVLLRSAGLSGFASAVRGGAR